MDQYKKALVWLDKLASEQKFFHEKVNPTLKVVNEILDFLGRPDKSPEWRVVISGTAGKGSVCRYVEETLIRNGQSVALISSPEIQVITERVRVNGKLISATDFGKHVLEIKEVAEELNILPTYYEAVILSGILAAQKIKVDVLICEVGIGGELDGVNAVSGKRIAACTFVGGDHLEMFNDSVDELAKAKAGVFTRESILNLTYEQNFRSIFEKNINSKIVYLKGVRQKMNKKIARKICEHILSSNNFTMHTSKLSARWEKVSKNIILEGAHSAPRFEYVLPKIKKINGKKIGLIGMMKNHDFKDLKIILKEFDEVFWTQIPNKDSWDPETMKNFFKQGEVIRDIDLFLKEYKDSKVLVIGSFYLCGSVREYFYSSKAILEQQTEFPE